MKELQLLWQVTCAEDGSSASDHPFSEIKTSRQGFLPCAVVKGASHPELDLAEEAALRFQFSVAFP